MANGNMQQSRPSNLSKLQMEKNIYIGTKESLML